MENNNKNDIDTSTGKITLVVCSIFAVISAIIMISSFKNDCTVFGGFFAVVTFALLVAGIATYVSVKDRAAAAERDAAAAKAKAQAVAAAAAAKAKDEQDAKDAAQAAWEAAHAKATVKVAGVTYKNNDGSSRQAALKRLYTQQEKADTVDDAEDFAPDIRLGRYTYEGAPAISVVADGAKIGNVPAEQVAFVQGIMPYITSLSLEIGTCLSDDDGETIYCAALEIVYTKASEQ